MARLPTPGSDDGIWGSVLNDYLSQAHNADGTLKNGAVPTNVLADGAVTAAKLSATSPTSGQVLSYDGTALAWTTAGSASGINNQSTSAQTADFWISGTGRANGGFIGTSLNTPSPAILRIGASATITNVGPTGSAVSIDSLGATTFNNNMLVRGTTTSNATLKLMQTVQTGATTLYGFYNQQVYEPSAPTVSNIYGQINLPVIGSSTGPAVTSHINSVIGMYTRLDTGTSFTGQISGASGMVIGSPILNGVPSAAGTPKVSSYTGLLMGGQDSVGGNTTGTVENRMIGLAYTSAAAAAGGTLNNHGIRVIQPNGSGAGTTNNYGITMLNSGASPAAGNWSLYNSVNVPSHFNSAINLGTTANPNSYLLNVAGVAGVRQAVVQPSTDASGALKVNNAAGTQLFAVNTNTNTVSIPKAASDPAINNGDMYYNTTSNTFRTCVNGVWQDIGTGSGTTSNVKVYENYSDAPALPVDTVVISRTGL